MPTLTRRHLVRAGIGVSVLATTPALATPALTTPALTVARTRERPFVPYTENSYFKSPVAGREVNARRTRAFRAFMRNHPDQNYDYPRINGVEGNAWGTPFAIGRERNPVWKLVGEHHPKADILFRRGFHAPRWLGDMLTRTSDSPLCVVDRASGFTMFCADAQRVGRREIRATAASITYHSSNGLDYRNPRSNDERNVTSRGRISDALVIRSSLVRHGVDHDTDLGHVLHLFLVETRSADGFRHPMVGRESGKHGFGAQGERLAIAPDIDLSERRLSPEGLVIARTLQRYGCYIGDNAGSASALKAQQETRSRPLWQGRLRQDSLRTITWQDFVVLQ